MVEIIPSNVLIKNIEALNNGKQYICNEGGTRSTKTYSILQLLYMIAKHQNYRLISIVSETMPHLKRGAIRDFMNILGGDYSEKNHNKTDNIYTVNNTDIEFFSADNSGRVRGPARDILFVNEATNIKQEIYDQLDVRTRGTTFIDWNPSHEFWAHNLKTDPNAVFIHSTYKDNPFLTPKQIQSIEKRRFTNPNWWRVYGEGKLGMLENLVFQNWDQVDVMPDDGVEVYGLDWGYTNDPTALIRCVIKGENIYLSQVIYEHGLQNDQISRRMEGAGLRKRNDEIFADCAEPKSIDFLYKAGWNIKAAEKGKDSIISGIDFLQQYKIYILKSSTDLLKEFRQYSWQKDKNDKMLNKPIDDYNHGIDAVRYAITMKLRNTQGAIKGFSFSKSANW